MGKAQSVHKREVVYMPETTKGKKVLMLGAGETGKPTQLAKILGKSTLFKQSREIVSYWDDEQRDSMRVIIIENMIKSMLLLVEHIYALKIPFKESEKPLLDYFNSMDNMVLLNVEHVWNLDLIQKLTQAWKTEAVQLMWNDRHKINNCFPISMGYYMERIERMKDLKFIPTLEDVLWSKVKTTGILESEVKIGDVDIRLFDTGGQRNERKKWIHCFEDAHCIVFTASLIEFATLLYEDSITNRAIESLELFDEIVNSRWFSNVPVILLLSKDDLLCHTKLRYSFKSLFPDFSGRDDSCEDIIECLIAKFMEKYKGSEPNKILPIVVNAIDTFVAKQTLKVIAEVAQSGTTAGHHFVLNHKCNYQPLSLFQKKELAIPINYQDIVIRTVKPTQQEIEQLRKEKHDAWEQQEEKRLKQLTL